MRSDRTSLMSCCLGLARTGRAAGGRGTPTESRRPVAPPIESRRLKWPRYLRTSANTASILAREVLRVVDDGCVDGCASDNDTKQMNVESYSHALVLPSSNNNSR